MNSTVEFPMPLRKLLAGFVKVPSAMDRPITGLATDSRQVREGDLFLARRGLGHHGLEFLTAVRDRGAAAIVWEPPFKSEIGDSGDLPMFALEDLGHKIGPIAGRFFGDPARDLNLIGITGTDGKTSCAHFIAQSLSSEDRGCGLLGTLGYGSYGQLQQAVHTTPDALTVQRLMRDFRAHGMRNVVMEVSSHALDQGRVAGLNFTVAILTNLTRDHLDYHGDLTTYAEAKRQLFIRNRPRHGVLNLDDAFGRQLAAELRNSIKIVGYGLGKNPSVQTDALVWGRNLRLSSTGLNLEIISSEGEGMLQTGLLGRFNASNLLAALATLLVLGLPLTEALKRLSSITSVPGRMERFGGIDDKPLAVVDYAHTPHALEQVLGALREHAHGRLWCVFGCGGERDPGKRPLMGACVEKYATHIIVTNDNPRSENPQRIIRDILSGMQRPQTAEVLQDRKTAITQALMGAAAEDIILIAGKGHEEYQLLGGERIPFSDREVVSQWVEAGA